jgi:hypothetical protein
MKRILMSVGLAVVSAAPLLAQQPDTVFSKQDTNTTRRITDTTVTQRTVTDTAYGETTANSETASNETYVQPPGVGLTPYAGYMVFGNNFSVGAGSGASFASNNAFVAGAELGLNLGKSFSIVGNVGYTKPSWDIGTSTAAASSVDATMWLFDGALRLRFPLGEDSNVGPRFVPFIQAGAGAIHYSLDTNPFGADGNTNFAFNAGAGADIRFARTFGIRLMAKDYVTSLSWSSTSNVDLSSNTSSNWALSLGLVLGY